VVSVGWGPWRVAGWILLALILDDKVAPHLSLMGENGGLFVPDFTRIALVWVAFTSDVRVAAWCGFVAGLLLDVAVPEAMGARALSLSVAAYGVSRIAGEVDGMRVPVHVVVLTAMGLVDAALFRVARHITEPVAGLSYFARDLLELVPTALAATLVLLIARRRRSSSATLSRRIPT
jgi:rod shape-determining protein MreD